MMFFIADPTFEFPQNCGTYNARYIKKFYQEETIFISKKKTAQSKTQYCIKILTDKGKTVIIDRFDTQLECQKQYNKYVSLINSEK